MCYKIINMGLFTYDIINWFNNVCATYVCADACV